MAASEMFILEARQVTKLFPGVRALDKVDFQLRPGEIHALVGENGAGKSTLMHILGGVFPPDSGSILIGSRKVTLNSPYEAARAGISVVYQELSLVPSLSIAENIFANRQPSKRGDLIDWQRLYARTAEMLALFHLDLDPRQAVRELSSGKQQMIEILKAISYRPKVLILDEPTSSLSQTEANTLFDVLRSLKREGISIIFITHHLQEIFAVADRVTVFRDGRHVITADIDKTNEDEIVTSMVGRKLADVYGKRTHDIGEEYFRVEGLTRRGVFTDVNLAIRRGEIVGLAGLVGSGRTELARAIFAVEPPDKGAIFLDGQRLFLADPADAIRNGIGYLTEDRKLQGLFLRMSVAANCVAPSLRQFEGRWGLLKEKAIDDFAERCRRDFSIVTPSVKRPVGNLSGGNQQKVLLSMWLGIKPRLLIVDEPTKGVDVGARSELYQMLRSLAASGVGILMISSDLPEVLGMSDRILVMREGCLVGEFDGKDASEEGIIACAAGVTTGNGNGMGNSVA